MTYLRGFVVLFALTLTGPALADFEFYTGAGIGRSDNDAAASDLASRLSGMGYTIDNATIDAEDGGMRFHIGLAFTDIFAVELGYVDLGEVRVDVTGSVPPSQAAQFTQDVADAVPVMPRGLTLAAVARVGMAQMGASGPIADNVNFAFKLGLIDADSERIVAGVRGRDEVDASAYYALNVGFDFTDSWRGVLGYEVYNVADSTGYWFGGLEFRFPQGR